MTRKDGQAPAAAVAWPEGTPEPVRAVADILAAVLRGRSASIAAPATALVLGYLIAESGDDDLRGVLIDLGEVARRHGAMRPARELN
jgi:hypothetical protein